MAIADPRPLAELNDLLLIKSIAARPVRADELSGLGSSEVLAAEMADPLWAFDVTLDWYAYASGLQLQARLNSLHGPMRTFYLTHALAEYPATDPDGIVLDDAEVLISQIGDDNQSISFSGLPAGYQLTLGDFFHVDFSSAPTRRGFFQMSETVIADETGTTPFAEVFPHLWPGMAENLVTVFARPACKVFIPPDQLQLGRAQHPNIDGIGFTAMQRL